MNQERPLLIVTSCTRNYGWVTRAFLEGNTRWADYIIIVDQMSTDATRPLIAEYNALHSEELKDKNKELVHQAEIITINDPDMTYKENTRAKMAFMKGRELAAGRDAIYFALDIDEVMPANWMKTEDGKKILESKPGDMFQLEWANIMPDGKTCHIGGGEYKIFHDNGMEWQEAEIQMHTPLLPYSSWDEEDMKLVHDFPLLHFGDFYPYWTKHKWIYYQYVDVQQHRSKSAVSIYRMYHNDNNKHNSVVLCPIEKDWLFSDIDLIGLVDTKTTPIFIEYIKEIIAKDGIKKFQSIDVWTDELCSELGVKDPRSLGWKCLHVYLRMTQSCRKFFVVKTLDKIIKKIC